MLRLLLLLAAVVLFSQACVQVATSGAQAVYNHQSIQKSVSDQYATLRAYQALDIDSDQFKNANINVATFNREILLSGQVPATWQKMESERLVRKATGFKEVHNWIDISPPSTQLTRLQDTWITTKVKAKLITAADLDPAQIKVVTENGTVFLMGTLKPNEADEAAHAASSTSGVHKVVKLFSYIKISKTPV